MNATPFMNRITGLLIIEAVNSNPNGDPDRESDPRQRPNGFGEISPVSFKSKLRGLVGDKEGPVWQQLASELKLSADNFEILESKGRNIAELKKLGTDELLERFWDVRLFGTSLLEKDKSEASGDDSGNDGETKGKRAAKENKSSAQHIHTGALQYGTGISLAPVRIIRNTTTIKRGVQEGKDRGMAPLGYRVVEYGLYAMPFFFNPTAARPTKCTAQDLELMLKLLPYAYSHTASYVRPQVNIRHAWVARHGDPLGSCPDWMILEALTPRRKTQYDPANPAMGIAEFERMEAPEKLRSRLQSLEDLAATC